MWFLNIDIQYIRHSYQFENLAQLRQSTSLVVSPQFSSPAKAVSLAVFSLWYFHSRRRIGSLFDGVCHLMGNSTTAWSLRPIVESLETHEKASGTVKKARSKTDGEVAALKRVGKVVPCASCFLILTSAGL